MPLTFPQLERHLFTAAHILCGRTDASEFKEEAELSKGRKRAAAEKRANHPTYYAGGETFFVPPEARGAHPRDEVHNDVGDGKNGALGALEESNTSLDGVLTHSSDSMTEPCHARR